MAHSFVKQHAPPPVADDDGALTRGGFDGVGQYARAAHRLRRERAGAEPSRDQRLERLPPAAAVVSSLRPGSTADVNADRDAAEDLPLHDPPPVAVHNEATAGFLADR